MKCLVWNFSVDRVRKSAAQNLRFCGFWNPRGRGRCLAHDFITKQELWIPCFEEVNHTRKDHGKSNAMDSTCYSSAGSKCVLKEKQHGCNLLNLWLHSKILLSPLLLLVLCCEHFLGFAEICWHLFWWRACISWFLCFSNKIAYTSFISWIQFIFSNWDHFSIDC